MTNVATTRFRCARAATSAQLRWRTIEVETHAWFGFIKRSILGTIVIDFADTLWKFAGNGSSSNIEILQNTIGSQRSKFCWYGSTDFLIALKMKAPQATYSTELTWKRAFQQAVHEKKLGCIAEISQLCRDINKH